MSKSLCLELDVTAGAERGVRHRERHRQHLRPLRRRGVRAGVSGLQPDKAVLPEHVPLDARVRARHPAAPMRRRHPARVPERNKETNPQSDQVQRDPKGAPISTI